MKNKNCTCGHNMKNENCTCGHNWDMHQGYGFLECLTIGCDCQEFDETQQNPSHQPDSQSRAGYASR